MTLHKPVGATEGFIRPPSNPRGSAVELVCLKLGFHGLVELCAPLIPSQTVNTAVTIATTSLYRGG